MTELATIVAFGKCTPDRIYVAFSRPHATKNVNTSDIFAENMLNILQKQACVIEKCKSSGKTQYTASPPYLFESWK